MDSRTQRMKDQGSTVHGQSKETSQGHTKGYYQDVPHPWAGLLEDRSFARRDSNPIRGRWTAVLLIAIGLA